VLEYQRLARSRPPASRKCLIISDLQNISLYHTQTPRQSRNLFAHYLRSICIRFVFDFFKKIKKKI